MCLVESKRFLIILSKHICKQLFDMRFLNKLRMEIEKKEADSQRRLDNNCSENFPE